MDRLRKLAINSEGFIFDPTTGDSYTVNETGLFIIEQLRQNKSPDEISEQIKNEFGDAPEEIGKDISDFITHLHTYNLV